MATAASPPAAQAQTPNGKMPGAPFVGCLFAATSAVDGCAGAKSGAATRFEHFFTGHAKQSGQVYASGGGNFSASHPPPWNVAGADYPVGAFLPVASLIDPAVTQPANCAYKPTGSPFNSAYPYLRCGNISGQDVDIEGYNFGPVGGHDCTPVILDGRNLVSGTTATIKDNLFQNGIDCANNGNVRNTGMLEVSGVPGADIIVVDNSFIGQALDPCCNRQPFDYRAMGLATNGNLTFEYNAVLNWPNDPLFIAVGGGSNLGTIAFNYIEGWTFRGGNGHGEWGSLTYAQGQTSVGSWLVAYNTIVSSSLAAAEDTALLWYSQGTKTIVFAGQNLVKNNTVIANFIGGRNSNRYKVRVNAAFSGNVVTITSHNNPIMFGPGSTLSGTGTVLYQYLGDDAAGRPQYSFDCVGIGGSGTPCQNATKGAGGYFNPISPDVSLTGVQVTNATGNAAILTQNTYNETLQWMDNYVDATGTSGGPFWARGVCHGTPGSRFSGNVDMLTGAPITGYTFNDSKGC